MSGDRNKSPRSQAEILERQVQAMKLLVQGRGYEEIASQLGYASRSGAYYAVQAALRALREERLELAETVMDLQLSRYEQLLRYSFSALEDAEEGREVGRAQLIAAARGVLDSMSRLYGLDKPSATVTVRSESALDRDLARLVEFVKGEGMEAEPGDA